MPHKGSIATLIHQLVGGLRSAMGYLGWAPGSLPETERAAEENLALPMWGGIDGSTQERVVDAVRAAVGVPA